MIDRKLFVSVSITLLLTLYDLHRFTTKTNSPLTEKEQDEISSAKLESSSTITVRYCHSSGYQNMFKQFSELVHKHYPNIRVVGENYPSSPWKQALARIFSMVKMALLICLVFSQNPFSLLNLPTPRLYFWALRNKIYACLMLFFLSNSIESYLTSSGAFEIALENMPLWSKLETGRVPSADEFVQMLQTHLVPVHPSL